MAAGQEQVDRHSEEFVGMMDATRMLGIPYGALRARIDAGLVAIYGDPCDGRRVLIRRADVERMLRPEPIARRPRDRRVSDVA